MNDPDPIPRDFGLRYILWFCWSNAITGLSILQGIIAYLMLDEQIFDHTTFRYIVLANAILTGTVSQIKRNYPPGPPPTKIPTVEPEPPKS
jgi:hypothetical protein